MCRGLDKQSWWSLGRSIPFHDYCSQKEKLYIFSVKKCLTLYMYLLRCQCFSSGQDWVAAWQLPCPDQPPEDWVLGDPGWGRVFVLVGSELCSGENRQGALHLIDRTRTGLIQKLLAEKMHKRQGQSEEIWGLRGKGQNTTLTAAFTKLKSQPFSCFFVTFFQISSFYLLCHFFFFCCQLFFSSGLFWSALQGLQGK